METIRRGIPHDDLAEALSGAYICIGWFGRMGGGAAECWQDSVASNRRVLAGTNG